MAAITFDGLTKAYGDLRAVDDVSFEVDEGEIFGYLGANGAGKSTTIRVLMGFLSPTVGGARLLGHDVTDESALVEAKGAVGYLPDELQFDESATGREILDLHAGIRGDERREELLALFDPPVDRKIREYSHGNVKKLGLVTAFMHDPDLVVLDEPTGGLDPLVKQRFADFVRAERDQGLTVFFSSHILSEVRRLCDRVGVIREGRLVTVDPIEALLDRSGKVVHIVAREALDDTTLAGLDGVHDLEASPEARTDTGFREYTFTFTGDIDALLECSPTGDSSTSQSRKHPSRRCSCDSTARTATTAATPGGWGDESRPLRGAKAPARECLPLGCRVGARGARHLGVPLVPGRIRG
ncbi:MAG: ABC-type multidrug transport system, ATPase component [halophilic archaeon J07HX64]|jgi:ABC-type multidrug transport system, ATPase component|nr:MAG: ABC-type multidrug transport system, ATPase component [halophilic archaeon J07HX64]